MRCSRRDQLLILVCTARFNARRWWRASWHRQILVGCVLFAVLEVLLIPPFMRAVMEAMT